MPPAVIKNELDGLTRKECPNACGSGRCVISGGPICAHPVKGSHHHEHAKKPLVVRAKRMLGLNP